MKRPTFQEKTEVKVIDSKHHLYSKRGVSFRAKTSRLSVYNNAVKEKTMQKELFDCMITCGELDPNWYGHYKD